MKKIRFGIYILLVLSLTLAPSTIAAAPVVDQPLASTPQDAVQAAMLLEGFEGSVFPPEGWTVTVVTDSEISPAWTRVPLDSYDRLPHGGSWMAKFNSDDAAEGASARLESPVFSGSGSIGLIFWMLHESINEPDNDYIRVQISTNGGVSYEHLGAPPIPRYKSGCGNGCWEHHSFDLAPYAAYPELKIGILGVSSGGSIEMLIDNFMILGSGPDFRNSTLSAPETALSGDTVSYSLNLTNSGDENADSVTLSDPLPAGTAYVPGSLSCSAGLCEYDPGEDAVRWSGSIAASTSVEVIFDATVTATECGTYLTNVATIDDPGLWFPRTLSADTLLVSQPGLYESFDRPEFPPPGWEETVVEGDIYHPDWSRISWGVSPAISPHTGEGMARFNSSDTGHDGSARLVSPEFMIEPGLIMRYWMAHQAGRLRPNETLLIQVLPEGGSDFVTLGDPVGRYDPTCRTPCWKQHSVDLSEFVGQTIRVGFLATGDYGFDFYIDDITYAALDFPCPAIVMNPARQASGTCPGSSVAYELEVRNDTQHTETIHLSAETGWSVSGLPETVELAPGAAESLSANVHVPWNTGSSPVDNAALTANTAVSGLQDAAELTTWAYIIAGFQALPSTNPISIGSSVVYYNDHLYLIGGQDPILGVFLDLEIYSLETYTSIEGAPLPEGRFFIDCVEINGLIYCAGGLGTAGITKTLFVYNPDTDEWTTGPEMPAGLAGYTAAELNGEYYLIGGQSSSESAPSNLVYIYNPTTGWRLGPPMQTRRSFALGEAIGGKIYVAGGAGYSSMPIESLEVYDPNTGSWTYAAPMPGGGAFWSADAAINDRYLVVVGGYEYYLESNRASAQVLAYDTVHDTWSQQAGMNKPIINLEGDSDGETMWLGGGAILDEWTPYAPGIRQNILCPAKPPDKLFIPLIAR